MRWMRALPYIVSVYIPAWDPLRLTASQPKVRKAMVSSVLDTISPVESNRSNSLGSGFSETVRANLISSSVVLPMAETTATTLTPRRLAPAMRRATPRILSTSATEVPPYF